MSHNKESAMKEPVYEVSWKATVRKDDKDSEKESNFWSVTLEDATGHVRLLIDLLRKEGYIILNHSLKIKQQMSEEVQQVGE